MAGQSRADYAPSTQESSAVIEHIEPGSPAELAGLKPGMSIVTVNGEPLRDMIDWQWLTDGPSIFLEGLAPKSLTHYDEDFEFEVELKRDYGESWGIDFSSMVFDGIKTCKNACVFCFMSMLPQDLRSALYIKDDDFRLSFLQGNFVTFTNIADNELERIIEQHISPLNMSLHASDHEVRRKLIGKFEARGLEVLDELLDEGIEIHAQIVLCPGLNDGKILEDTLNYVKARPGITSLGIVPLGYTKFQKRFEGSYTDREAAQEIINLVEIFQKDSRNKDGITRYNLADEFYLWAHMDPPLAKLYDGYPQYYDGIGMYRSFIDDVLALKADKNSKLYSAFRLAKECGLQISFVSGTSFAPVLDKHLSDFGLKSYGISNTFFGGNVDVAGLLVESDILDQLPYRLYNELICLPEVMFNFDGLTLEGMHKDELIDSLKKRGAKVLVVSSEISEAFSQLTQYLSCVVSEA